MIKSFAGFFNEMFYAKDHAYRRLSLFREWRPFHLYKPPITFDAIDIQFLQQFPRRFWKTMMVRRYRNDLFDALKDRQDRRDPFYQKKYEEILPELMERWKDKRNGEKMAKRKAALVAEEYAVKQVPDVEWPAVKTYTIKGAGKGKAVSVKARTFMKELVQRLEGNFGDPNGYDLSYPRGNGDQMACRGFKFPKAEAISDMLSEWLNYIAHHMLGDLPDESKDIKWRADHGGGSGKTKYDDTFTVNKLHTERKKYWIERIPTEENVQKLWQQVKPDSEKGGTSEQIRNDKSKIDALASALADRDVQKMVEDGKVRTPPTPHHPQGRVVKLNDAGNVQHPSLYMPHKKVTVTYVNADGEEEKAQEEVPYLLPGKFLRKLSPAEAESNPKSAVGKHWNHDSQRFEAQYVPVTDHPAPGTQGTDHMVAGGVRPNHHTKGRKFMDPSDENYEKTLDALNHAIEMRSDGQSAEIYEAIEQALEASNVGGMGNYERQVLKMMKRDLHNLAYMMLMDNLEDERIFNQTWRKRKIRDMVANYGQQDWGQGTRRKRRSKVTNSLDSEVPGEDGEETMTLADKLGQQLNKAKSQALALRGSGKCKVGPGERHLKTGECQFEYDLRQLHDMLDDAEQEANKADADIQRGDSTNDEEMMGDGVQAKLDATFRAFTVLKAQHTNMGSHEAEAEKLAMQALQKITEDEPTARTMIDRAKREVDRLAKQAGADVEKARVLPADKNAGAVTDEEQIRTAATNLRHVEETLQKMLDAGQVERYLSRADTPEFATSITQLMAKYPKLTPQYKRLLQQVADVKKQRATPVPQTPSETPEARQASNAANRMNLNQMIELDRLELIPFNAQFRRMFGDGKITHAHTQKLLDGLTQRQGTLFARDGDAQAIEAFKAMLGTK